jgi:SAM-dependent methyltransferase
MPDAPDAPDAPDEGFPEGFFRRIDEQPDDIYYATPRKVVHLDDAAIEAVSRLYGELIPKESRTLDLMSSWRSHLPPLAGGRVVGLGMNSEEMEDNPQLDEIVVHDLNASPLLPFPDASFDAVLCCVSVQYLVHPLQVFADVSRVLRPGGPFIVTFSNRCFPEKAVGAWLYSNDVEHGAMVKNYFERTPGLLAPRVEDRSPERGDPVYAVWARKVGGE